MFVCNGFFVVHGEENRIINKVEECPDILDDMREKSFTIRHLEDVSSRLINYWENIGLLPDLRENNSRGWRKFSMSEIFFIAIVSNLRDMNLSAECIKRVKSSLFNIFYPYPRDFSVIEAAMLRILYAGENDGNLYLVVGANGQACPLTLDSIAFNRYVKKLPDMYVSLNLNSVFLRAFPDSNVKVCQEFEGKLSPSEIKVLNLIRSGQNADKINLTMRDGGKIDRIGIECAGQVSDFGEGLHNIIPRVKKAKIELDVADDKIQRIVIKKTKKVSQ